MTTHKTLIIIGAGGHGRVVADCAEITGDYQEIIFLDDCFHERKTNHHWQIVAEIAQWSDYLAKADFIVAIGDNKLRLILTNKLLAAKASLVNIIHPTAVISKACDLGIGNVIFANAVINIGTKLHHACIINTAAIIDHDCQLHAGVHISPGAHIAGGVTIGKCSWLGIACSVNQYLTLADNTQVGAAAAVISNTLADSLYVGIPAKKIK